MIGAYRDDKRDLPEDHPFRHLLEDVKLIREIQEVKLDPLSTDNIDELLTHITSLEQEQVRPLSEVILCKTNGNPFVVVEFLHQLETKRVLSYSSTELRWIFDLDRIKEFPLSGSSVDIIAPRIRRTTAETQHVLKVASCLYVRFHLDSLFSILERLDPNGGIHTRDDLRIALDVAVSESLLERISDEYYRFSHDLVQQGAYSLLAEGEERDRFHLSLGTIVECLSAEEHVSADDRWIFIATDQYNRGSPWLKSQDKRLRVARLNAMAAKKAIAQAAFAPAWSYIQNGISFLESDSWDANYKLTLELYTCGTEMAACLGLFEDVESLGLKVLEHSEDLDETAPVKLSRITALASQNNFKQCMQLTRVLLKKLGERMPEKAHMGHVISAIIRTKLLMRKYSDDDILTLPPMTDPRKVLAMKAMQRYSVHAQLRQKTPDMLLAMLKLVQISMKYGLNQITPSALGSYAIVLASPGDMDSACRLGGLGAKLLDNMETKEWEANFIQLYTPFVQHWKQTYTECMEMCYRGYLSGMRSGDLEFAFYNASCYCSFYFMSGLDLVPLEKDFRSFLQQMIRYKKENSCSVAAPNYQIVLNLMGRARNPLLLTGNAMDEDSFVAKHSRDKNTGALQTFWVNKGQILFYFGEMEQAELVFKKFARTASNLVSHFLYIGYAFHYALVVLDLSRKTKKRKYRVASRKMIRTFKKWVSGGNINLSHKLMLLEAENLALTENREDVLRFAYDKAIGAASRAGFVNDAAIANERAGICFQDIGSSFWAESYLSRSVQLFSEWGARGKVEFLLTKYPDILKYNGERSSLEMADIVSSSSGTYSHSHGSQGRQDATLVASPTGTSFRAKERFDPDADKHFRSGESGTDDFMPSKSMDLILEA